MTTAIFTEFLNSLNEMRCQNHHILMFLDNCSSHPHLHLSNVKLCFYPKNTTSKLQAMDQGVIANLKQKYNKRMSNMAHIKTKTAKGVHEIIKDIKIFDSILHAKVIWEAIDPITIQKCFRQSGIQECYDTPQTPPATPTIDDDHEFAKYFEELLDYHGKITWLWMRSYSKNCQQEPQTHKAMYVNEDVQQDDHGDDEPPV